MHININASKLLAILIALTLLSGCGIIRDRSSDYTKEEAASKVVVPPWYRQNQIQEAYPIAEITKNQVLPDEYELPAPPDATLHILKEQFSVEVQDDYVWLLVNEPPSRVWASFEHFFRVQGINFDHSDPKNGLAQGAIRGNSALGNEFLKEVGLPEGQDTVIMIRIRQGIKRNSSEAQVRLLSNADPDKFYSWDENNAQMALEKSVLEKARKFLAENREKKSYSLLASDIGGPAKVSLIANDITDSYLLLNLDFDRAWSVVLRSLRDSGLPVADIDRSKGIVYLDVKENDKKCHFLGFFCSEEKTAPEYDYRLDLKTFDEDIRVYVSNMVDPEDLESQSKILALLLDNAS